KENKGGRKTHNIYTHARTGGRMGGRKDGRVRRGGAGVYGGKAHVGVHGEEKRAVSSRTLPVKSHIAAV
ncbi:hypothetical protein, partial [Bacteroides eggerthii]|uniref:hypothetical protein n=1 Tax=Bacteroides eggerthii TaxID=28111 RepID=UPI00356ABCEC